jgi:hypothetical protein
MGYSSYKNLFRIKWKIYSLDSRHPLPRPIPLDGLFIFVIGFIPSRFLAIPVASLFDQPLLGVTFLLDILLTWLILKYDPQGRPVLLFVYDFFAFLARSKRRNFSGQLLQKHRKIRLWWEVFDLEE